MALPTNEHRVHSDGYMSDRGGLSADQRAGELADEVRETTDAESVDQFGHEIEVVVHDDTAAQSVESTAYSWDATVEWRTNELLVITVDGS